MSFSRGCIRFRQGQLSSLRQRLLGENRVEQFALLFGRSYVVDGELFTKIIDVRHPNSSDYASVGFAHLSVKKNFVYHCLVEAQERGDVDTIIDVHTHPFCAENVSFSGLDDADERAFYSWLTETLDAVYYGSIVLSKSDYSARIWCIDKAGTTAPLPATVRTQTAGESWPCADNRVCVDDTILEAIDPETGCQARSVLALGLNNLRKMMVDQKITIVGVGGLGSVIAENLVHSGFTSINLIDHDHVEMTNLNRIVGAYYEDARAHRLKVDVIKEHLQRINPAVIIEVGACRIEDLEALALVARADWLVVATDSHASRFSAQTLALQFGLPLLAAGANITVEDGDVSDMSGEVIIARSGDGLCLSCLGRINPTLVAAERHKGELIGEELVSRGYVRGENVKEPAVKTLNAIIGALAVECLLNQYTERQVSQSVTVFENNRTPVIYEDTSSVMNRNCDCYHCA